MPATGPVKRDHMWANSQLSGWLLLLSRLLIVAHPINFAFAASAWIGALPIRGLPLAAVLVARLVVTAVGIAAGVALSRLHPGAVTLAAAALALSGSMDVFIYTTSFVPNNRIPGDTPFHIAATVLYHAGWIAYLLMSRRVRRMFD
jgi:hypothetical protein